MVDIKFPVKCPGPDCPSVKEFPSLNSLAQHMRKVHHQNLKFKELEALLMKNTEQGQEQAPVKEAPERKEKSAMGQEQQSPQQIDISSLLSKIESLGNQINGIGQKIPDNLCEEFPHLCHLKDRVSKMEDSIDIMGKKIPSKIIVHTGKKAEVKEEEARQVEEPKTIEAQKPVETPVKTPVEPPVDIKRLDSIQESIDKLQKLIKEDKEAFKQTPAEIKTEEERLDKHKHPSTEHEAEMPYAHDLVNCPTCRGRILTAFKERANGCPVDDPFMCELMETFGFLNKEKEGVDDNASKENIQSADEGDVRGGDTGPADQQSNSSTGEPEQRTETGPGVDTAASGSKETRGSGTEGETPAVQDTTEQPEGGDICAGLSKGECRALLRRRYKQQG